MRSVVGPSHAAPPLLGAGFVQVLDRFCPKLVTLSSKADQSVHNVNAPFTGKFKVLNILNDLWMG